MSSVDKALETQLKNLQTRAGKSLDELYAIIRKAPGEIRDMLKNDLGMGHGDANTLVHARRQRPPKAMIWMPSIPAPSAGLRPIHEKLMAAISKFGPFEIAPKKAYVSLRRRSSSRRSGLRRIRASRSG